MKRNKKKNKHNNFSIYLTIGLSLVVVLSLFLISIIIVKDTNSYFARIRVAIKKKVQIVYNYNLFDGSKINNSGIKEYDSDKQVITFDGKLEGKNIELGKLNVNVKKGERYRVTINYLSGSYDKNGEPKFIFELQKDNEYYTDRKNGTHYMFEMLPTKKDKPIDKVLTITDEVLDATNILYRLYQENEVEFKNYKIQVLITKLESKIGVAGDKYGKLPTPEKSGYEFLGWYDSISGGKKVTETNTILKKYNHPLYAHWKRAIHPYRTVNYDNFKWTSYKSNSGPLKDYTSYCNPYAIWAPDDVKDLNGVELPLIVWLHGSAEFIGESNASGFLKSGLLKVMSNWKQYNLESIPAIIVAPQGSNGWWAGKDNNRETIKGLIKYATAKYKIDKNKIMFVGHSMGGFGAAEVPWELRNDVKVSNIVIMSSQETSYQGDAGKAFYSNIKIRGYGEAVKQREFFNWLGKPNNFRYYPLTKHGDVPEKAMTEDLDKNGISDLAEWLFYDVEIFDETSRLGIEKRYFIGDSRTTGMCKAIYDDAMNADTMATGKARLFKDICSCKSAMGLDWMRSTGIPNIEDELDSKSALIILMGANGLEADKYIEYVNERLPIWKKKGAKVYYVSINPCNGKYNYMNDKIDIFNSKIQAVKGIKYIDTNSYLKKVGFYSGDGLHYSGSTYLNIYNYILNNL